MKYQKQKIESSQFPALIVQLQAMCKQGNETLENMKCVYKLKENGVIHLYSVLELLEHIPAAEQLEYFYLLSIPPSEN